MRQTWEGHGCLRGMRSECRSVLTLLCTALAKDLSSILMGKPVRPWMGDIGHKKVRQVVRLTVVFSLTKMEDCRASRF